MENSKIAVCSVDHLCLLLVTISTLVRSMVLVFLYLLLLCLTLNLGNLTLYKYLICVSKLPLTGCSHTTFILLE